MTDTRHQSRAAAAEAPIDGESTATAFGRRLFGRQHLELLARSLIQETVLARKSLVSSLAGLLRIACGRKIELNIAGERARIFENEQNVDIPLCGLEEGTRKLLVEAMATGRVFSTVRMRNDISSCLQELGAFRYNHILERVFPRENFLIIVAVLLMRACPDRISGCYLLVHLKMAIERECWAYSSASTVTSPAPEIFLVAMNRALETHGVPGSLLDETGQRGW